jgi:hypothetical protein
VDGDGAEPSAVVVVLRGTTGGSAAKLLIDAEWGMVDRFASEYVDADDGRADASGDGEALRCSWAT